MASLIGKKISHYRILRKIGEGGMGVVYQARDTRLEREVALKVLASGMLEGHDSRQRFRREALALSHLNHPNIATVYDFDADQDVDFLSMEMIHGSTLGKKLDRGPVAGVQALAIGAQIAEALAFAHAKGVIHRDLKPGNIMITANGLVKVPEQRLSSIDTARAELEAILGGRRALAIRRTTTLASSPHNLPHPGTSFIGREAEIATCRHLLAESRLLTLTGSAGCGKTRLALEVAESAMVDYPDGVWFVDLAPLRDGTRVAQALASALGVREEA